MTTKTLSLRLPLGLYEQLEREALERKISVAQVIIENIEGFRSVHAVSDRVIEAPTAAQDPWGGL